MTDATASLPAPPRRAARAGLAAMAAKLAGAALGLGVNIVLARLLGPAEFGLYALAIAVATGAAVLATMGMPFAAIRHVPDYLARADWPGVAGFTRASLWVSLLGTLFCAFLFIVGPILAAAAPDLRRALLWGAVMVGPATFAQTLTTLLQARGHVVAPEILQSLLRQGLTLLLIGGAVAAFGALALDSALAAITISMAGSVALLAVLLHRAAQADRRDGRRYELRLWARTGGGVLLILMSAALNERIDILMLGWLVPPEEMGVYAAAARVASVATIALAGLNAAFMPRLSGAWAAGNRRDVQRLAFEAAAIGTVATLVLALGAGLLGGDLLAVFGEAFRSGAAVLVWLLLTQVGLAAAGLAGGVAVIAGHDRLALAGVLAGIAANVALNLWLTPIHGILGAAMATCLALTLSALVTGLVIGRRLRLRLTLLPLGPREARHA